MALNTYDGKLFLKKNNGSESIVEVGPVYSVVGRTGTITLAVADISGAAPLISPTLIGTPTAPTSTPGTNTTQIATTAFVTTADNLKANLDSPTLTGVPTAPTAIVDTDTTQLATTAFVLGQAGTANPIIDGVTAPGTSTLYSRQDHIHPIDTSRAPVDSPALTGTPTAPTAISGTNTTQIATTAFVESEIAPKAPIDSPALTGTPTAPTAISVLIQPRLQPRLLWRVRTRLRLQLIVHHSLVQLRWVLLQKL